MSTPSGFGLLTIYPGILSDPPGWTFFRTGLAGTVDLFMQSATGVPQTLFSVFTGEQIPLDLMTGVGNSFNFNQGVMHFGPNFSQSYLETSKTGALNVYWNGAGANDRAGLVVTQRNAVGHSGNPGFTLRETANVGGFGFDYSVFIGNKANFRTFAGGNTGIPMPERTILHAPSIYGGTSFNETEEDSANYCNGYVFGRWDGFNTVYGNLGVYYDYTEVGHFTLRSDRALLGGRGALVIRDAESNPTTYHPSGVTIFASGDGSVHLTTSQNKQLKIAPGITGVDQLATTTGFCRYLTYDGGVAFVDQSYDGRLVIDTSNSDHEIYFNEDLPNGFRCEILHAASASKGSFGTNSPLAFAADPPPSIPGGGERSFVTIISGYIHVETTFTPIAVRVGAKEMWGSVTSGAQSSLFEAGSSLATYYALDFDSGTPEYAQADIVLPYKWEYGTQCNLLWTKTSGGVGNVVWEVAAAAQEDTEPLNLTWGTPVSVIAAAAGNSGFVNTFVSTIFPGGLISDVFNSPVKLRIKRNASSLSDTLAADARLLGIILMPGV